MLEKVELNSDGVIILVYCSKSESFVLTLVANNYDLCLHNEDESYDEIAVKIANELKHEVIGFSILGDAGATFSKEKVENAFLSAKKGEIVIIHMNHPQSQTADGTIKAIKELKQKGFRFVRLSDYKLK